ncbi:thiamine biosynthesis protein ThiS [Tamlana nanhaiensis]|uniref:Thiamine biosynthesis protein ThiS n=1 Tax=Neotamlana nanhaiensis TaxID=1382798 RepID=A0A0D7VXU4_9FLAO|nr:sulfur carrier protein ThiS [Tamlana nanhaiensis]KJD31710.1 thiamine biosynthesis protein ThiS [Tamlana nanhaiensis]
MQVKVNNTIHQVSENQSLQALVDQLQISTSGIAIAINNSVIRKDDWDTTFLKENQDVLIIKSTQGG